MKVLVDNDVLFKGSCYGLLDDLVSAVCPEDGFVGVLGAARFVLPKKIRQSKLKKDPEVALAALLGFLARSAEVEPIEEEQMLAADLELAAQQIGISLDVGESQLCAILVQRLVPLLFTGDKRAIASIEQLLDSNPRLVPVCGKVLCLEQAFAAAYARIGGDRLRSAVCAEPEIDKALTICFSCSSESVPNESHMQGLISYIADLRKSAHRALAP
jgi:hypothetical protein